MKLCGNCNATVSNNSYLICYSCSYPICFECFIKHKDHDVGNNDHKFESKLNKSKSTLKEDENYFTDKIMININEILSYINIYKKSLLTIITTNNEIQNNNPNFNNNLSNNQRKNMSYLETMFNICSTIRSDMTNLNNTMESYYNSVNEIKELNKENPDIDLYISPIKKQSNDVNSHRKHKLSKSSMHGSLVKKIQNNIDSMNLNSSPKIDVAKSLNFNEIREKKQLSNLGLSLIKPSSSSRVISPINMLINNGIKKFKFKNIESIFNRKKLDIIYSINYDGEQKNFPNSKLGETLLLVLKEYLLKRKGINFIQLLEKFLPFDPKFTYIINREDFKKIMKDLEVLELNTNEVNLLFSRYDQTNRGKINYLEFLFELRGKMPDTRLRKVLSIYKQIDKDQKGYINVKDINRVTNNSFKFHDFLQYSLPNNPIIAQAKFFEPSILSYCKNLKKSSDEDVLSEEEFLDFHMSTNLIMDRDRDFNDFVDNYWNIV